MSNNHSQQDKAKRLFSYLRELAQQKLKVTSDVNDFEQVIWVDDIPRERECSCVAWQTANAEDQDTWVEIKKPKRKAPPALPAELQDWITQKDLTNSSAQPVPITSRVIEEKNEIGESETKVLSFESNPNLNMQWTAYLNQSWIPWATEDQRVSKVEAIYKQLFTMHQKQQKLGEAFEVVFGIGLLTMKSGLTKPVRRHILTTRVVVNFDTRNGVISIQAPSGGAKLMLEHEMVAPQERPNIGDFETFSRDASDKIWDNLTIEGFLKMWTTAYSAESQYEHSFTPQSPSDRPLVRLAPAVILRKQTERSLIKVYDEIISQIQSGTQLPAGIRNLLETTNTSTDEYPKHTESTDELKHEEVLFPLASNPEQKRIADRLTMSHGVLVQGPPGTGKSHTIANLVCHLLSSGKKILVTSHTNRALQVLQDKFPEEISALAVSLLSEDASGLRALEDSVQGIMSKLNQWDANQNLNDIRNTERELQVTRSEISIIRSKLRSIREEETRKHHIAEGKYSGTLATIATKVQTEKEEFGWFKEDVKKNELPPLKSNEIAELIELNSRLSKSDEELIERKLPDKTKLISNDQFSVLCETERSLKALVEESNKSSIHAYKAKVLPLTIPQRERLLARLKEFRSKTTLLQSYSQTWVQEAKTNILGQQDRKWREIVETTRKKINSIRSIWTQTGELNVEGVQTNELAKIKAMAIDLREHLQKGGSLGFGPFKARPVKDAQKLIHDVYVNGRLCKTIQETSLLQHWIEIQEELIGLNSIWSSIDGPTSGQPNIQLVHFEDLCNPIDTLLDSLELIRSIRNEGLPESIWQDDKDVANLIHSIEALLIEERYNTSKEAFDQLSRDLAPNDPKIAHPVYDLLQRAISQRDPILYANGLAQIDGHERTKELASRRDELLNRLKVETRWCYNIISNRLADSDIQERLSNDFESAWVWSYTKNWLAEIMDPHAQQKLAEQQKALQEKEQEHIRRLCALKAWRHCFEKMTDEEQQHLIAWTQAVKKIGKGTGKHANRYRREAQYHMEQCRAAIPAWIMPIHRVTESIKPGTELYEVAIIDEASQSGPEALFLHYIAKKVVVVGDDKQISPDTWVDLGDVQSLREKLIPDIPFANYIGVESSYFDFASIRFKGKIRLREHFRCMPEIIQFSNNLCYQSEPLIPLKQFGADRIEPVVAAYHVKDGYQNGSTGKSWNPPEADAVVAKIKEIVENERYNGKTIGVISLLGDFQARHIEKKLLEEISPEEIERRELICGDAYAFQGDERDVIILSMVSAPTEGHSIGVLSKDKDSRRFNVAASRAKEQMILFHSATLSDLSPKCCRYKLLEYFQNPQIKRTFIDGKPIDEIREASLRTDRAIFAPPSPFDSWFEVDVFLKIHDRGYRVIPQYEVANRRIDLVIEGVKGQLAVECDGDFWHGPEKYEEDMARQRDLERCGWHFWRIRESSFRSDANVSLESLWKLLEKRCIHPFAQQAKEETYKQNQNPIQIKTNNIIPPPTKKEPVSMIGATVIAEIINAANQATSITTTSNPAESIRSQDVETGDNSLINFVLKIDKEIWFHVSTSERATSFEKKISYAIGKALRFKSLPSHKQSYWALVALKSAVEKGIVDRSVVDRVVPIEELSCLLEKIKPGRTA